MPILYSKTSAKGELKVNFGIFLDVLFVNTCSFEAHLLVDDGGDEFEYGDNFEGVLLNLAVQRLVGLLQVIAIHIQQVLFQFE